MYKDSVFTCILDEQGEIILEKRFGALTPDLDNLRDVLVEHCVGRVVMESTSIYWMPVWRVLETDFQLTLANPYLVKQHINCIFPDEYINDYQYNRQYFLYCIFRNIFHNSMTLKSLQIYDKFFK